MCDFYMCNFLDINNKLITKFQDSNNACFAPLFNKTTLRDYDSYDPLSPKNRSVLRSFNPPDDPNPGHVIYNNNINLFFKDKNKNIKIESVIKWYSEFLNSIGLLHELVKYDDKTKNAQWKVLYYGSHMQIMATLTALRYLDEDDFPRLIEWFYLNKQWANNDLEKLFTLFQLCHLSLSCDEAGELNANHALIFRFIGEYGGDKISSISTLKNFRKNMGKNEKFYLNGSFFTLDKNKQIIYCDLSEEVIYTLPDLLQQGKINEVLEILKTVKK